MKIKRIGSKNLFRVTVPANLSDAGKRQDKYFKTREAAQLKIQEIRGKHKYRQTEFTPEESAVFLLAKERLGSAQALLKAADHYEKTYLSLTKHAMLFELIEIYLKYLDYEHKARRTQNTYRGRLEDFYGAFGDIDVAEITPVRLREYLGSFPPGNNRRTHHKVVRTFIRWAYHNGYLATDLMDQIRPMDKWNSNTDIIELEKYRRLLFVVAGLEPFSPGLPTTTRYLRLLSYFVLGGLCGMRRSEILRDHLNEQILCWEDINWAKNLIIVPHEVAKATPASDRRRYIPLEPAAREWLQMVAESSGPVVNVYQATHTKLCRELFDQLGFRLPKNGLCNSYASYAQSFRSPGEVAKACGDLESTIRRSYIQVLEPDEGRAWFDIRPDTPAKIIQMRA